jgi:ATP-dependent DNA helicase RecG
MELGVTLRKRLKTLNHSAEPLRCSEEIDRRIRKRFPFEMTSAQNRIIGEIVSDLSDTIPMHRLLQGDVGSGKTVLALYAALVAVANRKQVAMIAPTEILAEQHYESLRRYLADSRVRFCLLTGGTPTAERKKIIEGIANGKIGIAVGTHALLEEKIEFNDLGLAIVDEQHKFGVLQRAAVLAKGRTPHYMVMTATPIPRTLALTVFGDLDVSVLDEMPPGRRPVTTKAVPPDRREEAYAFIRRRLDAGEQAFFVYPLVEEDRSDDIKAATEESERLAVGPFDGYSVGLLHGQMPPHHKDDIMRRFREAGIQLLVATVVVEVGLDVPNATVMVIEHAERFGLAQLHQLRGRIGRGSKPGFCLLFADAATEEAKKRIEIMTRTSDGFRIAEEDLRIRGPGEFFGTRQHGLPPLKVANLIEDVDMLLLARRDAAGILKNDPKLSDPKHAPLREALHANFAEVIHLIDAA